MATVYGFAGYRWRTRGPEFAPILPTRVRRVRFPLHLHGSALEVDVEELQVTYRLKSGEPVTAHHYGHAFTVSVDEPVTFPGQYRTSDATPAPDVPDTETIGPTEGQMEDQSCTAST
jgi:alpha,alpha-trehalose phosphorylase